MKKVALHNLGCKVNAYETEAMQEILEQNGYEIVPFEEKADAYIVNTCSVTNMADKKSRQMLHRAKKMNPEAVVIAAGCYVQSAGEELLKDTSVDILIGNNEKVNLPSILENWEKEHNPLHVHDLTREHTYEELTLSHTAGHTRAFMKIQDGCNQFCTYCIIPYTRGRVRSRRLSDIVAEAGRLAENGYQEVVLTGIHLDSYGTDLEEHENLLTVIQEIAKIDGIKRIRLGSLEPRIMTEEFVAGLAAEEKLCPHFHLSLQSGCDATLKRMNRRYSAEEFRQCCERLRRHFDDPALTTDVIVGFPGETEEEFTATVEFLKDICFYETHVFKYSRRKGTKADRMPDQIPEQIKNQRSDVLLALTEKNSGEYRKKLLGRTVKVLLEEESTIGGTTYLAGHTREYVKVAVAPETAAAGEIIDVKVTGLLKDMVLGE
ncbi:tRNA (N(6)-L-threonylcarbamoyladenosine(37)-C(2))-methylthiotransferase MtaB [Hominiventricola filiformis]|uniref:Threonylcarbamoyladenosine tRNA methylthiotransferase MtaB n=1 Tax=Hominiventricola filiformis TaxID=2885352 RepID=A0AAE3D9C9_9FIRM|nr:tRNA (N(6)-L-threonylcarbamoyladenosine(37)-C(2))-methylthiotransferase MtaB [Hominiventricola filiformis]MCC2124642.1 tRNA (N(6)-L-threonylcarbamoyladenosine(37)-C(2))-methylthiotransferase MtaB [Hominiventricola filiformis]MCI6880265.1 tRNA (N(6)-L-threonylcarbamoyladenosine(37)-C(2))-methylthiotransferase MtaB [Clostridiaceae bacterium]RHU85869.1 tRNA (N(6)-L-threonylcarbamoyladenosine(37)-C(2))-methylthiotransferase MtaB [Clostridiaceae bacterium OM08-6BH]